MSYIEIKSTQYNQETRALEEEIARFTVFEYILCECGKNFDTQELLSEHLSESKDSVCAENFTKEYQCMLCTKTLSTERACSLHYKLKHTGSQDKHKRGRNRSPGPHDKDEKGKKKVTRFYNCSVCDKQFTSQVNLTVHNRTHTGERPYKCPFCEKGFTSDVFLKHHVRTHTGEKPYECNLCHRRFSSKSNEIRHKLVHTGERKYGCDICGKRYQQMIGLKQHIQTIHDKIPLKPRHRVNRSKVKPTLHEPAGNVTETDDDSD